MRKQWAEEVTHTWCRIVPATYVLLTRCRKKTASTEKKQKLFEDEEPSTSTLSSVSPAKVTDYSF